MVTTVADNSWNGDPSAVGDWQTATNWLTPLVPLVGDDVTIANGGTARVSSGTAFARSLFLGGDEAQGFLEITDGSLSLSSDFGTGIFIGAGANSVAGIVQSGGSVSAPAMFGGSQVKNLSLGTGTASTGSYEQSGGSLTVQSFRIGSVDPIDQATGVTGSYTLSGTGSLTATTVQIGGGVMDATSSGSFTMSGGTATIFQIGVLQGGSLDVSGGRLQTTTRSIEVDSGGVATLSGGTIDTSSSVLNTAIGGSFTQTGGSHLSAPMSVSGSYDLAGGSLSIPGGSGLTVTGSFRLADGATLSTTNLTQTGGLFEHQATTFTAGVVAIEGGTYQLSGGQLSVGSSWTLGSGATFDFAGGSGAVTVAAGATVNLSQGTIANAANASLSVLGSETLVILPGGFDPATAFGTFTNEGTTYTVGSTLVIQNGRTIDLAGEIADPIDTAGTVTLLDSLVATADLTVREAGRVTGAGTVTVRGGTLRGKGLIETPVMVEAGTVAPGFSPGTLTIEGDWSMDSDSTLELEIDGSLDGQFDRLVVAGSTTLAGTLAILLGNELPLGTSLIVLENTGSTAIIGGFGANATSVLGGSRYTFDIDYAAGTGNDMALTVTDISPVPEPSAIALLVAAWATAAVLRRRTASQKPTALSGWWKSPGFS